MADPTLSDQIRGFVAKHYVEPARQTEVRQITIRAGDVRKEMSLDGRLPAITGALGSNKFQDQYRVRLIGRSGPSNASNSFFTFEILPE